MSACPVCDAGKSRIVAGKLCGECNGTGEANYRTFYVLTEEDGMIFFVGGSALGKYAEERRAERAGRYLHTIVSATKPRVGQTISMVGQKVPS